MIRVKVPGRVNLIGDHTDYTGGLVFPMTIDRYTTITGERIEDEVVLESDAGVGEVRFRLGTAHDPNFEPEWGRYVTAVASLLERPLGIRGLISTTIPVGAGLSSSAALEIASALALGARMDSKSLALLTQKAERLATGVSTGIMDQLCISSGRSGHGTLIDCHSLEVTHVPIPDDLQFVVLFIAHRTLVGSEYSRRVSECAEAELIIGPLRLATEEDVLSIQDPIIRRRARHVVTENQRVRRFADALRQRDYHEAGLVMIESHESLSRDYEVSTALMDQAVNDAMMTPGVYGARMTGGGFGGSVVALCSKSTHLDGWRVSASSGPIVSD